MSLNNTLYLNTFSTNLLTFFSTFIDLYSNYSALQVLMFVCPTVLKLHFYGCCHPCYLKETLHNNKCIGAEKSFFSCGTHILPKFVNKKVNIEETTLIMAKILGGTSLPHQYQ